MKQEVPQLLTYLFADFNFPNIDWDLATVKWASKSMHEKNQAQALLQFMEAQCLAQVIMKPMRGDILDLLLTNNKDMLHHMEVTNTLMSDHRVVKVTLWCKDPPSTAIFTHMQKERRRREPQWGRWCQKREQ